MVLGAAWVHWVWWPSLVRKPCIGSSLLQFLWDIRRECIKYYRKYVRAFHAILEPFFFPLPSSFFLFLLVRISRFLLRMVHGEGSLKFASGKRIYCAYPDCTLQNKNTKEERPKDPENN